VKLKHILHAFCLALAACQTAAAAGKYFDVSYAPSSDPKGLQMGVNYTLWIPEGAKTLRAIIVHQHGCGTGACQGGETAAYDLHWQALARKWDCALLGPSYQQAEEQNCRLWCDPRNGSAKTFLQAIDDLAEQSKHAELKTVPWCLWGHSGGGFWSSLMQTLYPDRIVAIWFRSGTAIEVWEKGEIPKPELSQAVYAIPMMINPGVKERGNDRYKGAWSGATRMFAAYRAENAPVGFAADPRTAHECGDARYLAIPFFDACLAMRLPEKGARTQSLKPVKLSDGWLAKLESDQAEPASSYSGDAKESVWLPGEKVAKAWMEYVKTGAVSDTTPPSAPFDVRETMQPDGTIEIAWDAAADFESGIQSFLIRRDGTQLAQLPEKPQGKFGRPLFQPMSYHDTPERPLAEMRYVDKTAEKGKKHEYQVIAVNGVGMRSGPAAAKSNR